MKTTKRILAVVMAVIMVMSLATTAFAEEAETTYQYEIYQIFTGVFKDNVLTDVKWGKNGTGTAGEAVTNEVLDVLEAVASKTDNEDKLDVILDYANLNGEAFAIHKTNDKKVELENLADGYYLVKDVAGSQEGEHEAYTTYIVKVVDGTLTIDRKSGVPTVDKVIVEGDQETEENEVSIGDTINYKFTGTLPSNIVDYDTYFYKFTDTMEAGLTYTNDLTVTVNGKDVTEYFYDKATVGEDGKTTLIVAIKDLLALEQIDGVGEITSQTKVVVTYTAVLNEKAEVGTNGNKNDVNLEYSNNPNDDGEGATNPPEKDTDEEEPKPDHPTGVTPKDEVWTYTTEIIIIKVDENGNRLTGAEFTLTGTSVKKVVVKTEKFTASDEGTYYKLKDGSYTETAPTEDDPTTEDVNEDNTADYESTTQKYVKETVTEVQEKKEEVNVKAHVGEDGTVTFTGLGVGDYTIRESVIPAGYNSVADMFVTIEWNHADYDVDNCTWTYKWTDDVGEGNTVTVVNQSGSTLPETGGMGTTILYVGGGILVLAAIVLLIVKRRANAE